MTDMRLPSANPNMSISTSSPKDMASVARGVTRAIAANPKAQRRIKRERHAPGRRGPATWAILSIMDVLLSACRQDAEPNAGAHAVSEYDSYVGPYAWRPAPPLEGPELCEALLTLQAEAPTERLSGDLSLICDIVGAQ